MAEESFQEKSEQATPKRREESRQKGQVARSTELSTVAVLGAGLLSLWGLGSYMGARLMGLMQNTFANATTIQLDPTTVIPHLITWIEGYALTVAPVMALLALAALAVNFAQVGVVFSAESLMPKGERISPLKGLKRIFSKKGLVELAKGLFKIGIVGYVTYLTIKSEAEDFVGFVDMGVDQVFGLSTGIILTLGFRITMLLLILAVLDYAFQRWDYEKNLRMTRQEVKQELKQQEGDPLLRSRIRSLQRDMSRRRMMGEVERADVVVTNPTHVAVALRYKPADMAAPVVVAKGQRLIAEKIKELARQAGVPMVEDRPLARTLFEAVKIGDEIPEELFKATAEVLAFVFQLRRGRATREEVGGLT